MNPHPLLIAAILWLLIAAALTQTDTLLGWVAAVTLVEVGGAAGLVWLGRV
jgi:hypothetical protein